MKHHGTNARYHWLLPIILVLSILAVLYFNLSSVWIFLIVMLACHLGHAFMHSKH